MPARERRSDGIQAQLILLGLVGFLAGYLGLRVGTGQSLESRTFAATPRYQVWALLVGAGTAYCGFVSIPLWQWYRAIRRRFEDLEGRRAAVVAASWCASITVTIGFQAFTGPALVRAPLDHYTVRMFGLLVLLLVVTIPAVINFHLVQSAARDLIERDSASHERGTIADLLFLQDMLRGLLATLGGVVTVAVLQLGALVNAVNAHRPTPKVPGEIILIAASLFAAGLAVLYLPAFSSLQRAGQDLIDELCPLPMISDEAFLPTCGKRDKLKSMLGLDASAKANLESGVLILTPLIGAAITTFLRV